MKQKSFFKIKSISALKPTGHYDSFVSLQLWSKPFGLEKQQKIIGIAVYLFAKSLFST